MKNIHVLPTKKLSRLYFNNNDKCYQLSELNKKSTPLKPNKHIYITSDEEIKDGDWVYYLHNSNLHKPRIMEVVKSNYSDYKPYSIHFKSGFGVQEDCKKIILTTDQDLIKDGVQAIDDESLEWFVKNPSCENIDFEIINDNIKWYKIIIPKEEPKKLYDLPLAVNNVTMSCTSKPKQETLEEASEKYENSFYEPNGTESVDFIAGAKWQAERMYSEEDIKKAFEDGQENMDYSEMYGWSSKLTTEEWFEKFKKK